jgi:tRNA dimethylallyltransferase
LRPRTARPATAAAARAPHRLYGHVDGAVAHSVGRWLEEARAVIEAADCDATLIFVGGSGLYFQALTQGLAEIPAVPDKVRAHWRERAEAEPAERLHAELARRDPDTARSLRPSDPQRILRALEVFDATGRSLEEWQREAGPPLVSAPAARLVLMPPREELYRRIDSRFETMLGEGAIEEVEALLARNLDSRLPVMKALGVEPLADYLRGRVSREAAATLGARDTRHYAKRQMTWLRGRMADWRWLGAPADLDLSEDALLHLV